MDEKIVISCPKCGKRLRIPQDKHITFTCPECQHQFEFEGTLKEVDNKKAIINAVGALIFAGSIIYFSYTHAGQIKSGIADIYYGAKAMIVGKEKKEVNLQTDEKINKILKSISDSKHKEEVVDSVIVPLEGGLEPGYKEDVRQEKLDQLIKLVDVDNEITNDYAVRLASLFPGEYNINQVCRIYDYIVDNWKYVSDSSKKDNFRSASRSINNNLAGDCDDFAILMAALIESIGGTARISLAYNETSGHAFAEVLAVKDERKMQMIDEMISNYYSNNQFKVYCRTDSKGRCWLNLDWFGVPRHPGGKYFKYTEITTYYPTLKKPYFE